MPNSHHTEPCSVVSYLISLFLTFGSGMLDFLDTHAPAFGVILGLMTFSVNFYFQRRNSKALLDKKNG